MENYTIIHEKSGVAVSFYADSYDVKSKRYYFWLGNDKVAEIPLEGYSIIYHATEKQISDSKIETVKKVIDEIKKDGKILETQDGNTIFNLTDGTISVKPQIPGTRYNVGSKDEYTMYDGDPKKYYKNK